MPLVPIAGETEQIRWECTHCNHSWHGKSKAMRTNSGNPTCSSCGRRSGSQPEVKSIDDGESKNSPNDQVAGALLGLALNAAIGRLTGDHQEVM